MRTPEQIQHLEKWVAALRSGKYRQAQDRLRGIGVDGPVHCCLGVACEVFKESTGQGEWASRSGFYLPEGESSNTILPLDVARWYGIPSDGCFDATSQDEARPVPKSLIDLNDTSRLPFADIADVIEEKFIKGGR
jgi:hypothetical protein